MFTAILLGLAIALRHAVDPDPAVAASLPLGSCWPLGCTLQPSGAGSL